MSRLTVENFHHRYKADERGCWIWVGAVRSGQKDPYGWVTYGNRQMGAHRAAWLLHCGPIPDGLFVCHHCDVRKCVNPEHLFLGNASQNMQDMWNKRRHRSPADGVEGSLSAKLTASQAKLIYARAAAGERTCDLAREFRVADSTISKIKAGNNWGRYV